MRANLECESAILCTLLAMSNGSGADTTNLSLNDNGLREHLGVYSNYLSGRIVVCQEVTLGSIHSLQEEMSIPEMEIL